MKARPILFSSPMVRALLDRQKRQTRRILRYQPKSYNGRHFVMDDDVPEAWQDCDNILDLCPYGCEGELLWVREAWRTYASLDHLPPRQIVPGAGIMYEAGGTSLGGRDLLGMGKLRPSMFMPRWVSRITLPVASVRVEPLTDISEADAQAEGAGISLHEYPQWDGDPNCYRKLFCERWKLLHGPDAWAENPWVWVVEFSVERANVDRVIMPKSPQPSRESA